MKRNESSEVRPRPAGRPGRLLLVDDHAVVRRGLAQILNMEPGLEVGAEASTAAEAMDALVGGGGIDAAVMDVTLGANSGIELIKALRARGCRVPILVLSMHDESLYAERALRAGAQGYVMKDAPPEVIVKAVRSVLQGNIHVSSEITSRLLGRIVSRPGVGAHAPCFSRLSDRELEVFQAIGEGRTTIQIARALKLSVKTIETYRTNIKEKLGLKSGLELVRQAMRWAEDEGEGRPVAKKKPRRR